MVSTTGAVTGRQLIVVAGPGRSGTSLFTGLASRLGLRVPTPEVAADSTNPHGFSEPRWAVDFHDQLLKSVVVTMDDGRPEASEITARATLRPRARQRVVTWIEEQFDHAPRVIVKDPRLIWFLGLYDHAADELGADLRVVTMLRDPAEVLRSRELAYGTATPTVTRLMGWLNLTLTTERLTRDVPRAFVRYDDLLEDWQGTVTDVDAALGTALLAGASTEQVAHADALVDHSLRRSVSTLAELDVPDRLRDLAARTFEVLGRLSVRQAPDATALADLDALAHEYEQGYRIAEQMARSSITAARVQARINTARRLRAEAGESATQGRGGLRQAASLIRGRGVRRALRRSP